MKNFSAKKLNIIVAALTLSVVMFFTAETVGAYESLVTLSEAGPYHNYTEDYGTSSIPGLYSHDIDCVVVYDVSVNLSDIMSGEVTNDEIFDAAVERLVVSRTYLKTKESGEGLTIEGYPEYYSVQFPDLLEENTAADSDSVYEVFITLAENNYREEPLRVKFSITVIDDVEEAEDDTENNTEDIIDKDNPVLPEQGKMKSETDKSLPAEETGKPGEDMTEAYQRTSDFVAPEGENAFGYWNTSEFENTSDRFNKETLYENSEDVGEHVSRAIEYMVSSAVRVNPDERSDAGIAEKIEAGVSVTAVSVSALLLLSAISDIKVLSWYTARKRRVGK